MIIYTKLTNKKTALILFLFFAFFINLFMEYHNYLEVVDEEIYSVKAEVSNIYSKSEIDVLKLQSQSFDFYTTIPKNHNISKQDILEITFM